MKTWGIALFAIGLLLAATQAALAEEPAKVPADILKLVRVEREVALDRALAQVEIWRISKVVLHWDGDVCVGFEIWVRNETRGFGELSWIFAPTDADRIRRAYKRPRISALVNCALVEPVEGDAFFILNYRTVVWQLDEGLRRQIEAVR